MKIDKVWAVYFSATGTTKRIVEHIAKKAAEAAGAEYGVVDFTPPQARTGALRFRSNELVDSERRSLRAVPNVLLKYPGTISGAGGCRSGCGVRQQGLRRR